ncbi:MAG: polysaccharide deacetylase family protein [Chitinophagaceae bacterium]
MFYLTHIPWWLKKMYPGCTWHIPVPDKTVFLTFDDGPHPEATPFVLQQLLQYAATATFFCIGKNVVQHPAIFEGVKSAGHAVGNHTMNHANGWKTSDDMYLDEIVEAGAVIQSKLFRPPYGRIKKSQLRLLKSDIRHPTSQIVMWSILSGDFDTEIDGERCFQNVIRSIKPGSIIVFHDSQKALPRLAYALPKLLEWMRENGYRSQAILL